MYSAALQTHHRALLRSINREDSTMQYAIDFKGHTNLPSQEIPSAVGMRGLYIGGALNGEYDFPTYRFEQMLLDGTLRPACYFGHRVDA
jgi:hypothetical protein